MSNFEAPHAPPMERKIYTTKPLGEEHRACTGVHRAMAQHAGYDWDTDGRLRRIEDDAAGRAQWRAERPTPVTTAQTTVTTDHRGPTLKRPRASSVAAHPLPPTTSDRTHSRNTQAIDPEQLLTDNLQNRIRILVKGRTSLWTHVAKYLDRHPTECAPVIEALLRAVEDPASIPNPREYVAVVTRYQGEEAEQTGDAQEVDMIDGVADAADEDNIVVVQRTTTKRKVKSTKTQKSETTTKLKCPLPKCTNPIRRLNIARTHVVTHLVEEHGLTGVPRKYGGNVAKAKQAQDAIICLWLESHGVDVDETIFAGGAAAIAAAAANAQSGSAVGGERADGEGEDENMADGRENDAAAEADVADVADEADKAEDTRMESSCLLCSEDITRKNMFPRANHIAHFVEDHGLDISGIDYQADVYHTQVVIDNSIEDWLEERGVDVHNTLYFLTPRDAAAFRNGLVREVDSADPNSVGLRYTTNVNDRLYYGDDSDLGYPELGRISLDGLRGDGVSEIEHGEDVEMEDAGDQVAEEGVIAEEVPTAEDEESQPEGVEEDDGKTWVGWVKRTEDDPPPAGLCGQDIAMLSTGNILSGNRTRQPTRR